MVVETLTYREACEWLADWVVKRKRASRPSGLFVLGVQGSIGRGKTVFCQNVVDALNRRLSAEEGQAFARSLDDYYLPKTIRRAPDFLARGYNPQGISNRGPAGTHDTALLLNSLQTLESLPALTEFPSFDKQTDDRRARADLYHGKIGVFILEGWFLGAESPSDPLQAPAGLKRSVASALSAYQPIFERLDALWAFDPVPIEQILADRLEQQRTLDRQSGRIGMTPDQIRRFVDYFYKDSWETGLTSPTPPENRISVAAAMTPDRQSITVRS